MKQQFLQKFVENLKPSARFALPGAGINAAIGMLTGGPVAALAYGGGDLLLNTPAIAAARVVKPGRTADIVNKAGKVIDKTLKPKLLPPQTIKSTDKVKINDTEYKRNKDGYMKLYTDDELQKKKKELTTTPVKPKPDKLSN